MAAQLLPSDGLGVDLCTGSGAIAMVMRSARPNAHVMATEIDPTSVQCARRNGVEVLQGDLDEPLPPEIASQVDVMVGSLPYVPTDALQFLPRDVQAFEPLAALDGGEGGLALVSRAVARSRIWIREAGWLLLEIGADQIDDAIGIFASSGYGNVRALEDDDGDPRGICGRRAG